MSACSVSAHDILHLCAYVRRANSIASPNVEEGGHALASARCPDDSREPACPRSSSFYHRARLDIADRYVDLRRTITEIFEATTAAMAIAACRRH